jgi:hypothetical protein
MELCLVCGGSGVVDRRCQRPGDGVRLLRLKGGLTYKVPKGGELCKMGRREPRAVVQVSDPSIFMQGSSDRAFLLCGSGEK